MEERLSELMVIFKLESNKTDQDLNFFFILFSPFPYFTTQEHLLPSMLPDY